MKVAGEEEAPGPGRHVVRPRTSARQRRRYRVSVGSLVSFTTNVCAGGFCAEAMRVLSPGAAVEGSLTVKGVEIGFVGQVAWVKQGEWRINLPGRMGVHFTRIDPALARLL